MAFIAIILTALVFLLSSTGSSTKNRLTSYANNGAVNINYPILIGSEEIYYFDSIKTNFYKLNLGNSTIQTLTSNNFISVKSVVWAKNGQQVLIKVLNHQDPFQGVLSPVSNHALPENTEVWWRYDFVAKKAYQLPTTFNNIVFAPDNKSIYYYNNLNGLYKADLMGKESELVYATKGYTKPLRWSTDGTKLLLEHWADDKPNISVYSLSEKTIQQTIKNAISASFSEDGQSILYQQFVDGDPAKLYIFNSADNRSQQLDFETSTEKVIWYNNKQLVVVVPAEKETYHVFDLKSAENKMFYSTDRTFNALDLQLSNDKKYLFFTSDEVLYRLTI